MHDLNTFKASDMYFDLMVQGVRTLKETEKGVEELGTTSQELFQQLRAQRFELGYEQAFQQAFERVFEQAFQQAFQQGFEQGFNQGSNQKARSIALKLLKEETRSLEWIAQLTDLSLEEVKSLQNQLVI